LPRSARQILTQKSLLVEHYPIKLLARKNFMTINRETASLKNMPWEQEYGYSQAVKVGDTLYISGQVSHDSKGNVVGIDDIEMQMRQHSKSSCSLWCHDQQHCG
jgi:enamine deaminase RidA (YjgF/YER057c/UK114 family)